jgi:cyclic pyranopterin phosphate synthase
MNKLIDQFGRQITYLRLSVTDRCNLRCRYCIPPTGINLIPRNEILSYEEMYRLTKVAVKCGINKLRITGGEPLIRRNIVDLISMLFQIEGLDDLGLTTNSTNLETTAKDLYQAGLRHINISLDTLNEAKYRWITRGAELTKTWLGIEKALQVGFQPLKLNVVVIKGFNDDELLPFARLTLKFPLAIRFIEFMPFNNRRFWSRTRYIPSQKMRDRINAQEELIPCHPTGGQGIAQSYRLAKGLGTVNFISPLSDNFCSACNRLRLTADGHLRSCLFSGQEMDIKTPLRQGADDEKLASFFKRAAAQKPRQHELAHRLIQDTGRAMHAVGG